MQIVEAKSHFENLLGFKVKQYQHIDLVMFYAELNISKIKIFYDRYRGFFIDNNDFKYETPSLNTEHDWNHLLSNLRKDRDLYELISRSIVDMDLDVYLPAPIKKFEMLPHFNLAIPQMWFISNDFSRFCDVYRYVGIDLYGLLKSLKEYSDYANFSKAIGFYGISDGDVVITVESVLERMHVSHFTHQFLKENGNPLITKAENNATGG